MVEVICVNVLFVPCRISFLRLGNTWDYEIMFAVSGRVELSSSASSLFRYFLSPLFLPSPFYRQLD